MKIVINKCFGGFGLSPAGVKRMAELQGKECYFFTHDHATDRYIPCDLEEATKAAIFYAFDVPNAQSLFRAKPWAKMTAKERERENALYRQHEIPSRPDDRSDPALVKTVEELGKESNGSFGQLRVVDIPDGVDWEIDEYDGMESVHERHRSWA